MVNMAQHVDFSKSSLWICIASILFNPIYWNIVARSEYRSKTLTKLAGGNSRLGCYGLAVTIFSLGILRDHLYSLALDEQPKSGALHYGELKVLAAVLFGVGSTLVVSSMWKLGVTGTYLGDYFGILMKERVASFPFNVSNNPMYDGSSLCFLSTALYKEAPAGIILSVLVYLEYKVACLYEEPFTGEIYAKRDRDIAAGKGNANKQATTGRSKKEL